MIVVVEVPRWTNAKLEISKEETFNPIKQGTSRSQVLESGRSSPEILVLEVGGDESLIIFADIKKGKLRFVRNCFPHHGESFIPMYRSLSPKHPHLFKAFVCPTKIPIKPYPIPCRSLPHTPR